MGSRMKTIRRNSLCQSHRRTLGIYWLDLLLRLKYLYDNGSSQTFVYLLIHVSNDVSDPTGVREGPSILLLSKPASSAQTITVVTPEPLARPSMTSSPEAHCHSHLLPLGGATGGYSEGITASRGQESEQLPLRARAKGKKRSGRVKDRSDGPGDERSRRHFSAF